MDFRQLSRFVAVVDLGSFNRAADALAVSQPSLSRSIRQLEESLGGLLFERGAQGVALTDMGEELLPHARAMLKDRQRATEALERLADARGQVVEIGTEPTFAARWLPRALVELASSNPEICVRVHEAGVSDLLAMVREGGLGFALGPHASFVDLTGLAFEPLAMESASVMMRAGHPALASGRTKLDELVEERWVVPDNAAIVEGWSQMFRQAGLPVPAIALRSSSLTLTKACIMAGDYVAMGDYTPYSPEIEAGAIVPTEPGMPRYERPVGIFRREGSKLTGAERLLLRILRKDGAVRGAAR